MLISGAQPVLHTFGSVAHEFQCGHQLVCESFQNSEKYLKQ